MYLNEELVNIYVFLHLTCCAPFPWKGITDFTIENLSNNFMAKIFLN